MCDEKVKELAHINTGIDLHVALQDAKDLNRLRMREIDFLREREKIRQAEHREVMAEHREIVDQLRALYRINMRVLNLVNTAKTGEKHNETEFCTRFDIH
jgi:hypothetical protein